MRATPSPAWIGEHAHPIAVDGRIRSLIRRVAAVPARPGSIDPALPADWVEQALWSLLYTAWLMATGGRTSKHEALALFLGSFAKVVSPSKT